MNLESYFRLNFALMQYHKYSLTEIENMMPWERDVYVSLLQNHIKEEEEKAIEELIQKDLMEALVGEDGLFYYELTDKGRKYAEKLRGGSWPFNLLDHDEGGELGSTDGEMMTAMSS